LSSVSSACDRNCALEDAIACGMSSLLVQVTVAPAATVSRCGLKVKLSIVTA